MGVDYFLGAVVVLLAFAIFDLIVGVTNDAVNFLNSAIGSKVAPRYFIIIVASLGIMAGVSFSSGMMEVARKGIFHPQFFTMPELMVIFLAVMLTDVAVLDLFSTFGLPTSTTVSIVFDLLGAAVAVSTIKVLMTPDGAHSVLDYINTGKALVIISGILLSIAVAFICGGLAQFFSRLIFTFDYTARLRRFGGIWGGLGLASITYFILIKGARGSTFITPETAAWIESHSILILLPLFAVSGLILQTLLLLKVNILKVIVLIGTFALAMAFAANDLVNFIGVPMAGLQAYKVAIASADPIHDKMIALGETVHPEAYFLLLSGLVMVITIWLSKKARTVSMTELGLGQHVEGEERFDSTRLSRTIVRMSINLAESVKAIVPRSLSGRIARRVDPTEFRAVADFEGRPPYDLLRASVNLMVASAVISYATSKKLPLSTTYVTFMVAMGSSFADQAWGLESAVYRVTGVLTVVGGWFLTALMTFTISGTFAVVIYFGKLYGLLALLAVVGLAIWHNNRTHAERTRLIQTDKVYVIRKVKDASTRFGITYEHLGAFLNEIVESLDVTMDALFAQNEYRLRAEKRRTKKIQLWANVISGNIFKSFRLMEPDQGEIPYRYGFAMRRVQKLADGHRDIVMRAYLHVANRHKGLDAVQISELREIREVFRDTVTEVAGAFVNKQLADISVIVGHDDDLRRLGYRLNDAQIRRLSERISKPRASMLYCAMVGDLMMLSRQAIRLLDIFSSNPTHSAGSSGASSQSPVDLVRD
jgi:phosphate/sulfate permease